jgi:hypothetical protein
MHIFNHSGRGPELVPARPDSCRLIESKVITLLYANNL